ncbi:protein ALTERED PHOSPHATE STARVATION RESPONSE 1-like [Zingiber officinale]|uniref:BZIP transcription factor n=1 Tax=Zingiber officinale TaxID=94328 RepID=A0A8J5GKT0_ZINOF|nr:protein ALTERED PHOSPHATE STARVATION RESPONSE 1-like [Zingiber officinale]KAG6510062.1 hypothetical protein ZIOFF_028070 [Zingiber officinale]
MGCSESKVVERRAVVLCHRRADLLAAVIRHRNALATAHAAYSDSLLSVSVALHRFLLLLAASSSSSPVLSLPRRLKSEPCPPPPASSGSSARYHHFSSRIEIATLDSDDEHEDEEEHDVRGDYNFQQQRLYDFPCATSFGRIHYTRSQPPPFSVTFDQRPPSYETVQVDYFDPYSANPSHASHPFPFPPGYYGSTGGFFNSYPSPAAMPRLVSEGSSSSRAPPPPPSPPKTSTWDFLNPFSIDLYSHGYTPSRSSGEVRHEEGIPDLEEVEQEVVQEATYDNPSFIAVSSTAAENGAREDEVISPSYHPSAASRSSNYDPAVIDKDTVAMGQRNTATSKRIRNALEVADAIKVQFQRASKCFRELSELLETGNHNDEVAKGSMGLASTLQKLYVWEKKLYHEVKSEEKMRQLLSKSNKDLRHLVEKGAEAHKIDTTGSLIDKLSMKIQVTIQVVRTISKRIDALRDEELWPLVTDLVLGLVRMWNLMLECHRMQCQTITEVEGLDFVVAYGRLSSANTDAILQLEMEMHKWSSNFSAWINAQRNYVKALNGWLLLCLPREHAETAPSPRRIGAPPVFTICKCWAQAMDRVSELEAINFVLAFADSLHQLWERLIVDKNKQMVATRDRERWLRVIEIKRKAMHKEVNSLNKKLAVIPGQFTLPVLQKQCDAQNITEVGSLKLGLKRLFEAMKHFSASSVKAYGELLEHCGEQTM